MVADGRKLYAFKDPAIARTLKRMAQERLGRADIKLGQGVTYDAWKSPNDKAK